MESKKLLLKIIRLLEALPVKERRRVVNTLIVWYKAVERLQ